MKSNLKSMIGSTLFVLGAILVSYMVILEVMDFVDRAYLEGREHGRKIAESKKPETHTCEPCDRRHMFPVGVVR